MKMKNMQITANEALLHVFVPPSTLYASVYKVREFNDPEYVNDTEFEIKFFEFLDEPSRELHQQHPLHVNAKVNGYDILPLESLSKLTIKPIQAAMAYAVDLTNGSLSINCSNAELMCGEDYATPVVKCEILAEISASINTSELRNRGVEFGLDDVNFSLQKVKKRTAVEVDPPKPQLESKFNKLALAVKFAGY